MSFPWDTGFRRLFLGKSVEREDDSSENRNVGCRGDGRGF